MASRRQRLAQLGARHSQREAQIRFLAMSHRDARAGVATARFIRWGLIQLGFDERRATEISRVAREEAYLRGLPPLPADYVDPEPAPDPEARRAALRRLRREVQRYAASGAPPPDFDKASLRQLRLFVMTRLSGACDNASGPDSLTPAAVKEDSTGPN